MKSEFQRSRPISFVKIGNFLAPEVAAEIAASFPPFGKAIEQGKTFYSVNKRRKVQITDAAMFPSAVARLNDLLASPEAPAPRKSFATYYYTREAPAHWNGVSHSTVFRARPEEKVKGLVLMPAAAARERVKGVVQKLKRGVKALVS